MKGDKATWIKIYDEKIEKESVRMIGNYNPQGVHRLPSKKTF